MEGLRVFTERSLGLLMLLFGYCSEPTTSNQMINQFITSPCSVSCGLLSFLFIPQVLRVSGLVSIFVGLMQVINLYFSTVLVIPLTALFKFRGWLTGLFGGGGSSSPQLSTGSGSFSPSTAIALIAVGALLASGDDMAVSVAGSVASILSGLLLSGMAFILSTAAGALRIGFCGAG